MEEQLLGRTLKFRYTRAKHRSYRLQDRKFIAKGVPRSRYLVAIDDEKDKKRIMTYASKGRAEAGFRTSFFYGYYHWESENKREENRVVDAYC